MSDSRASLVPPPVARLAGVPIQTGVPVKLLVDVLTYRNMETLGQMTTAEISIGEGQKSTIQIRAGGRLMNSATYLQLRFQDIEPYAAGFMLGWVLLTCDAMTVGAWRQFMFHPGNVDAPSMVHFPPIGEIIGWTPRDTDVKDWIYSFSIQAHETPPIAKPAT